ncbi:MAG: M48 family metallopeptidase [Pseudomonadota bacterium]
MAHASLGLVFVIWLLGMGLRVLNLRHLRQHGDRVPAGFESAIAGDQLRRVSAYTLARGRLGLIEDAIGALLAAIFLFGGVLGAYDAWIESLQLHLIPSGLIFCGILLLFEMILGLPFGGIRTFGIETRFGFNTTTPRLWLADQLKGLALSAILGSIVLVGGLLLISWFPRVWWIALWLFVVGLSVLMIYLAPVVIEPLFNVHTPVQDDDLRRDIEALAHKAGCKVSRVLQVDASRRSRHANAYFTGIGRMKRVVLYDTLLTTLARDEILAVLAHELGHWRRRHVLRKLLLVIATTGVTCLGLWQLVAWPALPALVGLEHASLLGRLVISGVVLSVASDLVTPVASWLSRRDERQADDDAVALLGDGGPLARALRNLATDNLANLNPHPWYAALYYTHPPIAERVRGLLVRAG